MSDRTRYVVGEAGLRRRSRALHGARMSWLGELLCYLGLHKKPRRKQRTFICERCLKFVHARPRS